MLFRSLVILTLAAGRNNEDQEVHLNFFDRWYTEIAAFLVFGIWIYGVAIMMQVMGSGDMRMAGYLVGIGILGIWSGAWFLTGWLSLVRRIKAGSIWRDSVLRYILLFIRKIFSKFSSKEELEFVYSTSLAAWQPFFKAYSIAHCANFLLSSVIMSLIDS